MLVQGGGRHESEFGNGRLEGVRVLVVDDEPDARDLLSALLRRSRAEVEAVASAADALNAIRRARPDVLLSDIGMPDEDGYALIQKVRTLEEETGIGKIPDVALSGAPLGIAQLLKQAGLAPSTSEGNRLIDGGGVRIDSAVVSDKALKLPVGTFVVQVGKRKFAKVTLT